MGKQNKNRNKKQNSRKKQPEATIQQQERITSNEVILLLPALFLVTIYMFCVRGRVVPSNTDGFFWSYSGEYVGDLYAYFRMQIFVIAAIIAILCLLIYVYRDHVDITKHIVYIPMAVYVVTVLLSYAFAEYKDIALFGAVERYEGTITLVCYMCILFYTMHAVRNERCVKLVVKCFCIACIVLGIWGVLQVCGIRLGDLPMWLYVPASLLDSMEATASGVVTAVTWFFTNQNYASFFMVFPVCIFAMVCISRKDTKGQVICAALTGLMMYNLWRAGSVGGMFALAVAFVAAILIAGFKNIWEWRKQLGLLVVFGVISMLLSYPVLSAQLRTVMPVKSAPAAEEPAATVPTEAAAQAAPTEPSTEPTEAAEAAEAASTEPTEASKEPAETAAATEPTDAAAAAPTEAAPAEPAAVVRQDSRIDYIITDGSNLIFSFAGEEYTISTENNEIKSVTDSAGNPVAHDNVLFKVSSAVDSVSGYRVIEVATMKKNWKFLILADEDVYFIAPTGYPVKLDKVETAGFEGRESFGSGRGYIWSRTLPMLKDTIFVGKGADTYMVYFPHEDYAGRYNVNMFREGGETLVDKPHNMYLGNAFNTGVLSVAALLTIYLIYIIESVRAYRRHTYTGFKDYVGMAAFIAVTGFLCAGFVYDTTVQIMPMVYVFMGMGFAINRMILAEKAETVDMKNGMGK